jgi:hypothetical protein
MHLKRVAHRPILLQALALLGCVALLYVATGAAFLHQHTKGPESTCPVCQVLHAPGVASARLNLVPEAQQIARNTCSGEVSAPTSTFAFHRTPRAPPSA